jgi:D-aminoacyl-tRNA deacylase
MRIVLQRVKRASVSVDGVIVGQINTGILILLGVHANDTQEMADYLAIKCANLRIFADAEGKMNRSLLDVNGEALVVSQFTLFGDAHKGNRPSFIEAAPAEKGNQLYEYFVKKLKEMVPQVKTGVFGAMMDVELINDGPVTLILEK